ncbi:hypothetical protein Ade02nite_19310 [Paractinoplanes deccanensis]|uniref:Uncharacterized protein n=1 Tax=Paractinoplanes deccanensis TaxID=113561 RepID=A0ABQ3Y0A6_9ACTN|nr:helix-turn-helix domain-containing protein [Actinoplanes deccanensis]GID73290.1 hypothetical protein Ade02nite_19310 [Actinoplanes deccanensis]
MTSFGKNLHPAHVASRRRRAVWMTSHGHTAAEAAREVGVSKRTVERYKAADRAGAR